MTSHSKTTLTTNQITNIKITTQTITITKENELVNNTCLFIDLYCYYSFNIMYFNISKFSNIKVTYKANNS